MTLPLGGRMDYSNSQTKLETLVQYSTKAG